MGKRAIIEALRHYFSTQPVRTESLAVRFFLQRGRNEG